MQFENTAATCYTHAMRISSLKYYTNYNIDKREKLISILRKIYSDFFDWLLDEWVVHSIGILTSTFQVDLIVWFMFQYWLCYSLVYKSFDHFKIKIKTNLKGKILETPWFFIKTAIDVLETKKMKKQIWYKGTSNSESNCMQLARFFSSNRSISKGYWNDCCNDTDKNAKQKTKIMKKII